VLWEQRWPRRQDYERDSLNQPGKYLAEAPPGLKESLETTRKPRLPGLDGDVAYCRFLLMPALSWIPEATNLPMQMNSDWQAHRQMFGRIGS
jgi:hypothetical protein